MGILMEKMRYYFILCLIGAENTISQQTYSYEDGDRYFYFPGGDGILRLVDTHQTVDEELLKKEASNGSNNVYELYTRQNPTTPQKIEINNNDSLTSSYFDASKTTVYIAHGWNGSGASTLNVLLTAAFLERDNVNVIVLDWKELSNSDYMTATAGVPVVGAHLGKFINWLTSIGASYDNMHLVGFSLGGHLVGNAGRETGSRVRRITALDPAGPLWHLNPKRLIVTDAQYVEVIHTNTALLGIIDPCGDVDIYPNGGALMPGCLTIGCSHSKSYQYMAATVLHNHLLANECNSTTDALFDLCSGSLYPMGNDDITKSGSGIFRVNTEPTYPF